MYHTQKLLPLSRAEVKEQTTIAEYIYEQPAQEIFNRLLPRYVEMQVYEAVLDALASEQSARMVAMQAATDAANEMVGALKIDYSRFVFLDLGTTYYEP